MPQLCNQIENSNQLRDQGKIKVYSRYTRVQETFPDVGVSIKRCSDNYTAESNIHSADHTGRNSHRENKTNRMRVLICNSNWKYLRTPSPCSIIYTPSWGWRNKQGKTRSQQNMWYIALTHAWINLTLAPIQVVGVCRFLGKHCKVLRVNH